MTRTEKRKRRQKKSRKRCMVFMMVILIPVLLLGLNVSEYLANSTEGIDNHLERVEENDPMEKEEDTSSKEAKIKVVFLGDTMMDGNVAGAMDQHGMDYPLREFAPVLQEADLIIANLETAVGTSGNLMEEKSYAFQTDPAYLKLFEPYKDKLIFTLANNHGMDGPVMETIHALEREGFHFVGIGRDKREAFAPYVAEINGVSMAIFGASRVIPVAGWRATDSTPGMATAYSPEPLVGYVEEWSEKVDYVVPYLHWGQELEEKPDKHQLALKKALEAAGANIIIGSHPHVLQAMEWKAPKSFTAYSLGNFVFTTSHTALANDTVALEMTLTSERIEKVKVYPAEIRFGLVRHLKEEKERARILDRLNQISPQLFFTPEGIVEKKQ